MSQEPMVEESTKVSYIYGLFSTKDNKIRYIGVSNNPLRRYKQHIYYSSQRLYHSSKWIYKELQNRNSIKIKILGCFSEEIIFEKEIEYIKLYKENGNRLVNETSGGKGGSNPSQETRKKLSLARLGNQWNKGRKFSEERKNLISKIMSSDKIVTFLKLKYSKPVIQINQDGEVIREFESAKIAAKEIGVSHGIMCYYCVGKRNNKRGLIFKYKNDVSRNHYHSKSSQRR